MTLYLLDENVLRELGPHGNANVRKWIATVDDSALPIERRDIVREAMRRRNAETPQCDKIGRNP